MWISCPIPIPPPTPMSPRTQIMMHITATNHSIDLIIIVFFYGVKLNINPKF